MAVVDEHEDGLSGVFASDAEVSEFAGVAEGCLAVGVDAIGAGAPLGVGGAGRCGFGLGSIGLFRGPSADSAVRAFGVVPGAELVEHFLQFCDGGWLRPGGQPVFEGLVEPFDLALGLRVSGLAVLLLDVVGLEEFLEPVAPSFASGQAGGEHQPVIGQGGGRCPVAVDEVLQGRDDVGSGVGHLGGDGQQVAGVVIEEVEDLHAGAVGEEPVGDIGLPTFVREVGFEAGVGTLRSFLRLGSDETCLMEDAADGRDRRDRGAVVAQMPGDGLSSGIGALSCEVPAQFNDAFPDRHGGALWSGMRCPAPWGNGRRSAAAVPGHEGVDPLTRDGELRSGFGRGESLVNHAAGDNQVSTMRVHEQPYSATRHRQR